MRRSFAVVSVTLIVIGATHLSASAGDHDYIGSKKCKMCHVKEYKSWEETSMAKAFDVLLPGERSEAKREAGLDPATDYTTDTTCLPCHVTGFGERGGFTDVESTPDLVGVGCEVCHGPGGTYTKPEYMSLKNKEYKKADVVAAGMVDHVTEDQCRGCHNTESPFVGPDYVFDFEANRDKGTHEKFPLKYEH
jgi:hypothetical protein